MGTISFLLTVFRLLCDGESWEHGRDHSWGLWMLCSRKVIIKHIKTFCPFSFSPHLIKIGKTILLLWYFCKLSWNTMINRSCWDHVFCCCPDHWDQWNLHSYWLSWQWAWKVYIVEAWPRSWCGTSISWIEGLSDYY